MRPLQEITVLITAAGNVFMPGTTACLKHNGERIIRLIGADMNNDPSILKMCDEYYPVPRGDDPDYINTLLEICRKEKVDVLLPIMSVELISLAQNLTRFSEIGTRVSVSDLEAVSIANNKMKLFQFLRKYDLPCADYYEVTSLSQLKERAEELGYPDRKICVKTTGGSGSRGFRILDASFSRLDLFLHSKPTSAVITLPEMVEILDGADPFPELMVMEYLPGTEYTVDLLADHGKTLISCCRKSLSMENSIMLDGITENNPPVLRLCETVTEHLGLSGNIGFDVKERADGTPLIMECNPRITAGIPVFMEAGVNLPYLNVKRLLGEPIPECSLKLGITVKRRWQEMSFQS